MNSENAFCRASEIMYGSIPTGTIDPRIIAKGLVHDPKFGPSRIGTPNFVDCVCEAERGGPDIYGEEVVERMRYLAELHLHSHGD